MRRVYAFRLTALLSLLLSAAPYSDAQVSGLFVYHTAGQTFLKWNASNAAVLHYTVYRSRTPMRTALALKQADQTFIVKPGQSQDKRLSAITASQSYFRFPGPAGQLSASDECFVVTVAQPGNSYYAVTMTTRHGEERLIRPGRNATASAVRERSDKVRPVFQRRLTWDGRGVDVFVHWASNMGNSDYPAMINIPCYPFHIGVRKNGKAILHPLLVRLHGRGDHFLSQLKGTGNPQEYIIALDDYLPGNAGSTFWFGYNFGIDVFGRMASPPGSSTVSDVTRQRLLWTMRWALRELPIDSTRVYLSGVSMGGSGAFFTSLVAPQLVSAALAIIPRLRFDIRDAGETPRDGGSRAAGNALWGKPEIKPVMQNGTAVYELLDGGRQLGLVNAAPLPPIRIIGGRQDSVVGWRQLAMVLKAADSSASGITAFWDERDHHSKGDYFWSPQQDDASLYRYRNNRSWPAFSEVSDNSLPADSVYRGAMNASVDWFEPVIDRPNQWSVGLRRALLLCDGDSSMQVSGPLTATITPRRLQRFVVQPGNWYNCVVKNGDTILYQARIQANRSGLISVPNVPIPEQAVRFELRKIPG